jgi:hypothetical protein
MVVGEGVVELNTQQGHRLSMITLSICTDLFEDASTP